MAGGTRRRKPTRSITTGRDYLASLRDGRDVWVLGAGPADDVAAHPATRALVAEYAAWYDRHRDPVWRDTLCRGRAPRAFAAPSSVDDLRGLGRAIHAVALLSGGNVTHTPGYGALIALGVAEAAAAGSAPPRARAARAFLAEVLATRRFVTFSSGGAPPGDRFRAPADAEAVRVVRRSRGGIVVHGMLGVHTAVPYAHEVVVLARHPAGPEAWAWFAVPVSARGVRVVTRMPAVRGDALAAPLSDRFDELDCMLWLDNVRIPDDRIFALGAECDQRGRDAVVSWLVWHQVIGWLARANFTLGLGIALGHALGTQDDPATIDAIVDLVVETETIRACLAAAELDPETTPLGHALPRRTHVAPAAIHALRVRPQMDATLRRIAGAPSLIAPGSTDLDDDRIAAQLERAFGGGGYTARQRAALLHLAWDHLSSSLAGREASYEMFGNGGLAAWRMRIRRWFDRHDEVAGAVRRAANVDLPGNDEPDPP